MCGGKGAAHLNLEKGSDNNDIEIRVPPSHKDSRLGDARDICRPENAHQPILRDHATIAIAPGLERAPPLQLLARR